jgi:hypothetical protein
MLQIQSELLEGQADGNTVGGDSEGMVASSRGFKPPTEKVQSALNALHEALSKRGTDSLVLLGKKFHIMDDDSSNGLSYEEVRIYLWRQKGRP